MRNAVRVSAVVSIAILLLAAIAGPATAASPTGIEDGGAAYQGVLLETNTDVASGGATVGIVTEDGERVQNVTANSDGTVTWDTDDLAGRYQMVANGSTVFNFTVRTLELQVLGADVENGTATVTLQLTTSDREIAMTSSNIPDFVSRTDGAAAENGRLVATTDRSGDVQLAIDVSDLSDGTYTIAAETTDQTIASTSASFTVDTPTPTPTPTPTTVAATTTTTSSSSGAFAVTTTTSTPTETATATQTATTTEATIDTQTSTPTDDGGVSTSDAAGAGATVVGLSGVALLARRYS